MSSKHWIRFFSLTLPLSLLLAACSSTQKTTKSAAPSAPTLTRLNVAQIIKKAGSSSEPRRSQLYLLAANRKIRTDTKGVIGLLSAINENELSHRERITYQLLNAEAYAELRQPIITKKWLKQLSHTSLPPQMQERYIFVRAELAAMEEQYNKVIQLYNQSITPSTPPKQLKKLWSTLLQIPVDRLELMLQDTTNAPLQPWLELAHIYRTPAEHSQQLASLMAWQQRWPKSLARKNLPESIKALQTTPTHAPKKIALLLPLSGPQGSAGAAVRDGFLAAYYQAKNSSESAAKINTNLPELAFYDTEKTNIAQLLNRAQMEGAQLIVGPLGRSAANEAVATLGTVHVPWLILNTINKNGFNTLPVYQFGLSSEGEAQLTAQRAWDDGYRHPIILTIDSDWGRRVAASFNEKWLTLGGKSLTTYEFEDDGSYTNAASEALHVNGSYKRANSLSRTLGHRVEYTPRRRQDIDMIFIAGSPSQGRQLKPALDFYFAYDLPVYSTSNMFSGQVDTVRDRDLNGIRIPLMPWFTESSELKAKIQSNWQESQGVLAPLYALGADAWRIYPRLEQMTLPIGAKMYGLTGVLSISPQKQIDRQLSWQLFRNGRPSLLTKENSLNSNLTADVLEVKNSQPKGL